MSKAASSMVPIRDAAEPIFGEGVAALKALDAAAFRRVLIERVPLSIKPRRSTHRVYVYLMVRNEPYIVHKASTAGTKQWSELKGAVRWIEKNLPNAHRIVIDLQPLVQ